ncbi:MAG: DUF2628 domain-containing protein [Pseudomonadota bacterium]
MTVYSVFEPPHPDATDAEAGLQARADKIAFVKEGFSWLALIIPILWLIYQRMWLELIVFLVVFGSLPWIFGMDPQMKAISGWVSLAITIVFAFEANNLRCWALARRGYKFAGTASGRGRTEAEKTFFARWLTAQDAQEPVQALTPAVTPPPAKRDALMPTRPSGGDEVIGSFPRS